MSWMFIQKEDGTLEAECRDGNKAVRFTNIIVDEVSEDDCDDVEEIITIMKAIAKAMKD